MVVFKEVVSHTLELSSAAKAYLYNIIEESSPPARRKNNNPWKDIRISNYTYNYLVFSQSVSLCHAPCYYLIGLCNYKVHKLVLALGLYNRPVFFFNDMGI